MKIIVFWDVYGRMGRALVRKHLPSLLKEHAPDFLIANSENLTAGKGPSAKHIAEFRDLGFDCLTGGNHVFSNLKDSREEFDRPDAIQLRPANHYETPAYSLPGKGYGIFEKNGMRILVANLMSGVFLKDQMYNPFLRADEILKEFEGESFDAVLVDFHRETTSEIYCMAEYLSGRASFVYGTHTHVQTNDEHVLPSGTGMIADIGMTGPLHSAIGQNFESRIPGMVSGVNLFSSKQEPMNEGWGSLHAVALEFSKGKCVSIEKIRIRDEFPFEGEVS